MFGKWKKLFVLALAAVTLASVGAWCALRPTQVAQPHAATPASDELPTPADQLESRFASDVRPFVERYCFKCHGPNRPKAKLDLSRDATLASVAGNLRHWALVLDRLQADEMPPEDATRQPSPAERAVVVAWLRDLQAREVQRNS